MGWANCGEDSKGRPIGYAHKAECDFSGCNGKIDRGLDYACGGMHGEDEISCENYFCHEHLYYEKIKDEKRCIHICLECKKLLENEGRLETA